MRQTSFVLSVVLVWTLATPEASQATDYNDRQNGAWNDQTTWNSGDSGYPALSSDSAIIDQYQVSVTDNTGVPVLNSLQVYGSGELAFKYTTNAATACRITLGGGGKVGQRTDHDMTLSGGLTVSGTNTLLTYWGRVLLINTVGITNSAPTDKLIIAGNATLTLGAPSSVYTGQWELKPTSESVALLADVDGALGTGSVTLDNSALFLSADQTPAGGPGVDIYATGNGIPDIDASGACRVRLQRGSSACSVTWPARTLHLNASSLYFVGGSQWNGPIQLGSGTSSFLHQSGPSDQPLVSGNMTSVADTVLRIRNWYSSASFELTGTNAGFTGTMEVVSGTLIPRSEEAAVGGTFRVDAGAMLCLDKASDADWILGDTLTGAGTIKVEDGTRKLTLRGGAIGPGVKTAVVSTNSAGILAVWGELAFTNDGAQYGRMNIDIAGTNNVAGTDYDRLIVSNSATALDYADLNVNIATNLTPEMLAGQEFTILTCANNLTGKAVRSVIWPIPGAQRGKWRGDVAYGDRFVKFTNLRIIATGTLIVLQ